MNIWQKILIYIAVLILCMGAGTGAMVLILNSIGISPDQISNLADISLSSYETRILKIAFGVNHLLSFIVSGCILIAIFSKKKIFDYTGITSSFDISLFLKFVVLLIISYPIFGVFIGLFQYLDLPAWADNMDKQNMEALQSLLGMDTLLDLILVFLIIAVFAGVGEELIFRGVMQKELYKHTSPTNAILISAFIFGAFHLEISGLIPKFLIGVILGYSFYITKNLLYPILLHTLNNGMQVAILYIGGESLDSMNKIQEQPQLMTILGGLIFIPFVYILSIHLLKFNIDGSNT